MNAERVLCAALWVDDGQAHVHQPTKTGIVLCALRHSAAIELASLSTVGSTEGRAGLHQGFLTSAGRFVDREEGFLVASSAGQLVGRHVHRPGQLCSEDLY